jgi:hypothetical protein
MRHVSEAKGFVIFENFIKASKIGANGVIFNVGSAFDDDVYKLFKVKEAYNWERYNRKYYKCITKPLMLFEKKLGVVVISYIEDFTYFIEFIEEDISKAGGGAKNLKIIKHMEDYETVNKLVGYVYVRPDSYIRIADGNEIGRILEQLIKQGWKLRMLA